MGNSMGEVHNNMAAKVLLKTLIFSTRVAVPGGVVYVLAKEGIWGSQEEAILFYDKVKTMKSKAGLDLPQSYEEKLATALEKVALFSNTDHVTLSERWYNAVTGTVNFLDSAPSQTRNFFNNMLGRD